LLGKYPGFEFFWRVVGVGVGEALSGIHDWFDGNCSELLYNNLINHFYSEFNQNVLDTAKITLSEEKIHRFCEIYT